MNEASAWKGGELEGLGKNARGFKQCAAKSDMHGDNFAIDMSYDTFFSFSTCVIGYQHTIVILAKRIIPSYNREQMSERSLTPMLACPRRLTSPF